MLKKKGMWWVKQEMDLNLKDDWRWELRCIDTGYYDAKVRWIFNLKKIRKMSNVPVIMLSARQEEYDKLYGFELGIDDYVTKPFSTKRIDGKN